MTKSRWDSDPEEFIPLGPAIQTVDHTTPAQRADNAKHDQMLAEAKRQARRMTEQAAGGGAPDDGATLQD